MFPSLLVVSVSPHNAHGILVPGGMFVSSLGMPKSQDTVIPGNKSHKATVFPVCDAHMHVGFVSFICVLKSTV